MGSAPRLATELETERQPLEAEEGCLEEASEELKGVASQYLVHSTVPPQANQELCQAEEKRGQTDQDGP